ncbi:uncharacterized protein LOC113381197 [Ctenocephalides felis]|uniref:uncharacterized protein LOC113381197 n=1 Tax=Ctenocephalides felis TaxID=7515 RepID=UPI000E6E1A7A|nr:uncharacterized protein LOC113381197 [Ctenocephalides felis]
MADRVMLTVAAEQEGFFFLDASGGTGKMLVISLILVRSEKIALARAPFGMATTLLDGGRTADSTFKHQTYTIKKMRHNVLVMQCAVKMFKMESIKRHLIILDLVILNAEAFNNFGLSDIECRGI